MAIVEVTVVPIGTSSPGLSNYVSGCLKVLEKEKDVKYQLTPMGTILEGDLGHLLEVIKLMHEQPFNEGIGRVVTTVRIDDRRDKEISMDSKVLSVKSKL